MHYALYDIRFVIDVNPPFLYESCDLLRESFHGPGHHKTFYE